MVETHTLPTPALALSTPPGQLARVLYAINLDPSRKFGSLEEQIFTLACAFDERGSIFVPLFVAPPDERCQEQYRAAGLAIEFLNPALPTRTALRRVLGALRRHRIDIVHWNFFPPLRNPLIWATTLLTPRVDHYLTDHISRPSTAAHLPNWWTSSLKRQLLRRYRRVLGVSEFVVRDLRAQRAWPSPVCCHHFVNTDRFRPDPAVRATMRDRIGDRDAFVIVAIAHLIREKGVDVLLRALTLLPPRVVLWLIGEGRERPNLEQLTRQLDLAHRVRFLGQQPQVQRYVQAADVFVCPSTWAEAAGLVNLEAQASGLPLIASDIGGIPEYVQDGRTGLLFPPGDATALATCVRWLADHPVERRAMGRRAREWTLEQFSIPARLGQYLDLYRTP